MRRTFQEFSSDWLWRALTFFSLLPVLLLAVGCMSGVPKSPAVALMKNRRPVCGASAIGPQLLVTAAHCVKGRSRIDYVDAYRWTRTASDYRTATVRTVDVARDVAFLVPDEPLTLWADVADVSEGGRVCAVSPRLDFRTHCGVVTYAQGGLVESTITVWPGWSGSPVFNAEGKQVAVVSAGNVDPEGKSKLPAHFKPNFSILAPIGN